MNHNFYFVDALAGAGKTHAAIEYALNKVARVGGKFVVAQPSKHLIQESYLKAQSLNTHNVRITRLDSSTHQGKVTSSVIEHLKQSPAGEGELLFITHATLFATSSTYWHNRQNWHVIVDEIPNVVQDLSLAVPSSHAILTDHLAPSNYNAAYLTLRIKEGHERELRKLAENRKRDAVFQVFEPVTSKLFDLNWTVYANGQNYQRVLDNRTTAEQNLLTIYGLMHPGVLDGFKSVTLMGAMFQESVLYLLWSQLNIVFKPHPIQKELRYTTHELGCLLEVEYLWERAWSKTFRDKRLNGGRSVLELAIEQAQRAMQGEEFLYITNKDTEESLARQFLTGARVSSVCQGINEYQNINNVVYLSALNPQPSQFCFLETLGVSGDELRRGNYLQSLYQAVMRTSLRDPQNTSPKRVLVMDKEAADYLALHFPGCKARQNPHVPQMTLGRPGRPKVWKDDAARTKANNEKKRVLRELVALDNDTGKCISIIPSIYSRDVINHEITSNQALMLELRQALETEISDKRHNILVSPARFDTHRSKETRRGLDNIQSIYGVWLDNDGGDLSVEEFRHVFPRLWFAAFSTHSEGGRYRVFIPTRSPMTPEADRIVKRTIMEELSRAGYDAKGTAGRKCHGFDVSKITPSSLFYIPCRKPGSTAAFFTEYEGEELDPVAWIQRPTLAGVFDLPAPPPPAPAVPAPHSMATLRAALSGCSPDTTAHKVHEARERYLATPRGVGQRNTAFYKFGRTMMSLGLSLSQVEQELRATADDTERRKQVPSILGSLRKKSR